MNSKHGAIKEFAVNVLGCGCPEELFLDIELNKTPDPLGAIPLVFEIRVGGRLFILGVTDRNILSSDDALAALVAAGKIIRDNMKFNRFRLVVISDDTDCEAILLPRFAQLPGLDDRIHLHVVKKELINGILQENDSVTERRGEMGEPITKPTIWHEMEGPVIGGREHYQEKSYGGFNHTWEPFSVSEETSAAERRETDRIDDRQDREQQRKEEDE
ncbi:MAG: hypothetical protein ABSA06_11015 [Geobacteraceae bacterium]|jgi:hypothetical protein